MLEETSTDPEIIRKQFYENIENIEKEFTDEELSKRLTNIKKYNEHVKNSNEARRIQKICKKIQADRKYLFCRLGDILVDPNLCVNQRYLAKLRDSMEVGKIYDARDKKWNKIKKNTKVILFQTHVNQQIESNWNFIEEFLSDIRIKNFYTGETYYGVSDDDYSFIYSNMFERLTVPYVNAFGMLENCTDLLKLESTICIPHEYIRMYLPYGGYYSNDNDNNKIWLYNREYVSIGETKRESRDSRDQELIESCIVGGRENIYFYNYANDPINNSENFMRVVHLYRKIKSCYEVVNTNEYLDKIVSDVIPYKAYEKFEKKFKEKYGKCANFDELKDVIKNDKALEEQRKKDKKIIITL